MSADDNKLLDVPEKIPLLPVRDIVVFPYMILPLFVGRENSIKAVEEALAKNRFIFLASQKELTEENPTENSIYEVGTIAMIMRMRKLSDGRVKILIQGVGKGRVKKYSKTEPFFEVSVEKIEEKTVQLPELEVEAMIRTVKEQLEKIIAHGKLLSPDILLVLDEVTDPGRLADLIASNLGLKVSDAQNILETFDHKAKLKLVSNILTGELEVLAMQNRIKNTAKEEMSKSQKEYFLREQLRAIKNELGDTDSKSEEVDEVREKILSAEMPTEVEQEALKQLGRLERMHPDASEASMIRTYLDWMTDLPWNIETEDNLELKHAKVVLDEDHHELEKIKERILEFLAVRKLKNSMKGPILCFNGPPGVGKTSLGKSIARAMGRKYFRISLGGVKDEAEIRGHRRTYVGAMPGKIVQALKQVKSKNAVIVLDEIDKLGSDFRGDPSAAMLEVLDPEQNANFRDNYLNVDFDLSNIMFIATSNVLENVPVALRDRMEVINLSGYTEHDKVIIAKKHVVERQIEANGITAENIEFTDEGLAFLVSGYTREAGLRNLEREIGSVCRKVAKDVVLHNLKKKVITPKAVEELLGPVRFQRDEDMDQNRIGVTNGLAWTSVGGEVLFIEAIKMKGNGKLVLTGQMGDVMKESATAAMSYAKANAKELGIDEKIFDTYDFHVHIPEGATPKDGPSAGITMATSLVSLFTDVPVRGDVAMTGEVTITGRVLPIGGLREKALAALRLGVKDVIIPFANVKDLKDIPEDFRKELNFIPVKHLNDVISVALDKTKSKKSSGKASGGGHKKEKIASAGAA